MFSYASGRIESELFHFLFPVRIKNSSQRSVFLIFGTSKMCEEHLSNSEVLSKDAMQVNYCLLKLYNLH